MDNKRDSERIKIDIKSEVHSENFMTFSTVADLSKGGIFIYTLEPLSLDSKVKMSIQISEKNFLGVEGVVKWIKDDDGSKSGMGIEFDNMTKDKFKIIENRFFI